MNPACVFTNKALLDLVMADIEDTLTIRLQPFEDSCSDELTIGRGPPLCVIVLADVLIGIGAAYRQTLGPRPVSVLTQDGFTKTPRSA
jgi:hypothetical protein